MKEIFRETAKGLPRYGLRHFTQRLRNLVGDFYLLLARPSLRSSGLRTIPKLIPHSWRPLG
jgi:hypothetical protein